MIYYDEYVTMLHQMISEV